MKTLDLTEEQARELAESDLRIDKGEKLFELNQEQKQVERAMKQVRIVDAYGKSRTRERKPNEEMRKIIKVLAGALDSLASVEVTNPEHEIIFYIDERKYKIVLSAPRK